MGKTAILAIKIIGDATEAVASLEQVDGSASSMQKSMDKASVGAGVALGALTAAAAVAGNSASALEQATGAVDSVFGTYAGRIHEYAAEAAQAVGLATSEYDNMAVVLGSQLKNMGLDLEASTTQTQDLISMGADLAAMFGGTTADAVGALSSLLRGERDPIERYGVSIKEADIAAKAASMGLEDLYKAGDRNASLQATLALLTEQTASAQGTFARESDTAAGQAQRAAAEWENASAALGEQLLPLMTEGSKILGDLARWMGENTEIVTVLAVAIGGLSAGILVINGAMKAYAAVQAIQTAAQWANNAAWLSSPITWIILAIVVAIAAVIAIVVLLIQHWDEVAAVAEDVWSGVIDWIGQVGDWFGSIFSAIGDWWDDLVDGWTEGIAGFIGWIQRALNWIGRLVNNAVPGWIRDLVGMGSARTFTAALEVQEPAPVAARMLFTADEAARGFAQPSAFAITTAGLSADAGSLARGADSRGGDTYVEVNFNGLVTDPEAVAREIRKVLAESDKQNGRVLAANVGGAR